MFCLFEKYKYVMLYIIHQVAFQHNVHFVELEFSTGILKM